MVQNPTFFEFGYDVLKRNAGEIGMHLHAWDSPPIYDNGPQGQAYLIEYPESAMREKIRFLTDLLEQRFQTKMVSHRAGRWAFDNRYARLLVEFEYLIDCSVTPHISWTDVTGDPNGSGGTDYIDFPSLPYFMDLEQIDRKGNSRLLEVPVTILKAAVPPHQKSWLRPDGSNRNDMLAILKYAIEAQLPCVEFMLHSSELMPGGSPSFTTPKSIEALYEDLEVLFKFAAEELQGATLEEFYYMFHCE